MRFALFCLVGSCGFAADIGLYLIAQLVLEVELARALAFVGAASCNWWLNRSITFAQQATHWRQGLRQWAKFIAASLLGGIPNVALFIWLQHNTEWASQATVLALAPGIALGLICNYTLARLWVFNTPCPAKS